MPGTPLSSPPPVERLPPTDPVTVLLVHNRYRDAGGEDVVFEAEGRLLEALGHRVVRYEVRNERIAEMSALRLGSRALWSVEARRELGALARDVRPDVAHVHNTFPLLSPSIYSALASAGAAVVQTLHNYRLVCPQGMLLRDGRPCEICVGRGLPLPGVRHACYRDSRPATAAVAGMLVLHRILRTWERHVHAFVAMSEFARSRFVAGGLPPDRLHVKPNFIHPDPGARTGSGEFFLYVGRLSHEKGVATLLEAWRLRGAQGLHREGEPGLVIVGDGPLAPDVARAADELPGLEWHGWQPRERVLELMGRARALIFPSGCYEGSPLTILEAFSRGLPVIASAAGSAAEFVSLAEAGRLFETGDASDLSERLRWAGAAEPELAAHSANARAAFERDYTEEATARKLAAIYDAARRVRDS